jgi:hypothetical protein
VTESFLDEVKRRAERAGRFARVMVRDDRVVCEADGSAEPAWYRVELDDGRLWVSLVMSDRWLSESIEADLMHTGDKLEDLIEEELVDHGVEDVRPSFEHFRSDDLLFTFRSPIGEDGATEARVVAQWLLAYEACFRNLGDMEAGGDDH